jgi:hypothetical protein
MWIAAGIIPSGVTTRRERTTKASVIGAAV